jgi:archaellum component FlaG (FlaF/FlaG flagellin family)
VREIEAVELLMHVLHHALNDSWNDADVVQENNNTWTLYVNVGDPTKHPVMTDHEIEVLVDNELERIRWESYKQ